MAAWMRDAALVVGAYLIGSVPFGYIFAKAVRGIDIRTEGSGNIGATNVGRVLGRGWGIVVFVLDVLKGFVPVLTALLVHQLKIGAAELPLAVVLTGLAAIAGHNWPVFLRFKGGKGVATSCGVFVAVFPLGLLISLGVWVLAVGSLYLRFSFRRSLSPEASFSPPSPVLQRYSASCAIGATSAGSSRGPRTR